MYCDYGLLEFTTVDFWEEPNVVPVKRAHAVLNKSSSKGLSIYTRCIPQNTTVGYSIKTSYFVGFDSGPKARAIPARASGPRYWTNLKKQEGLKARHIGLRGGEYNLPLGRAFNPYL